MFKTFLPLAIINKSTEVIRRLGSDRAALQPPLCFHIPQALSCPTGASAEPGPRVQNHGHVEATFRVRVLTAIALSCSSSRESPQPDPGQLHLGHPSSSRTPQEATERYFPEDSRSLGVVGTQESIVFKMPHCPARDGNPQAILWLEEAGKDYHDPKCDHWPSLEPCHSVPSGGQKPMSRCQCGV